MKKYNMPIYRAKKIDSDEYVEGYLIEQPLEYAKHIVNYYIYTKTTTDRYEIDPSTLAIHFPDMIDSKDTPIFASLSKDGKGGDLLEYDDGFETIARYVNQKLEPFSACIEKSTDMMKVIEIQK